MICKGCRDGAVEAFENGNDRIAEWLHSLCNGLCDCQHDTSQSALNPALISTSNEAK